MVNYMLMSDLQNKDIINISNGTRIGKIIDIEVNNDGTINHLIIGEMRMLKRINAGEYKIKFTQIKTIGSDVILIETI